MTIVLVINYLYTGNFVVINAGTSILLQDTLWPYKMLLEAAAHTLTTGKSGNGVDSRGLLGGLEVYSSMRLSVSPMVKQTAYLLHADPVPFLFPSLES